MPLPTGYVAHNTANARSGRKLVLTDLVHAVFTNPAAKTTNGIKTSVAGPNTTTVTYNITDGTLDGSLGSGGQMQFPFPRNVVITVTHATAVVALSGTITGLDQDGHLMTEAWSVTAGGTSKTFTGKKAFSAILSLSVTAAADASTDTLIAGNGDVLGLPVKCSLAKAIQEWSGGAVVTNGVVVAASAAATDDPVGTYAPNTIPNGSTAYEVVYVSDDPQNT